MPKQDLSLVLTTFDSLSEAKAFAHDMVQKKWISCAQLDPEITSIYEWEGKIEEANEVRMWMKVLDTKLMMVKDALHKFHSYDVPQWVVFKVDDVSEAYWNWVKS